MNTTYKRALSGAVSILALGLATSASAGGFALKERSTSGQGASFAGVTAGSAGIESMGFNPAAVTKVREGTKLSGGISFIRPIADAVVNLNGERIDADRFAGLTNGYVAHRLDPDLWIGLSVFTPFGLVTSFPENSTTQLDARTSKLQTFQFSPTLGIEPFEGFSIGVSGNILYADARLTSAVVNLQGEQVAAGFSVGALWDVTPSTTIGLAYDHGYDLTLAGDAQFGGAAALANPALAPLVGVSLNAEAEASVPGTISGGIVQGIGEDFRLLGEVQYQFWSAFDSIDTTITGPAGNIFLSEEQNYENAFFVAVGGEYDFNDNLTVRVGAAWDETPTVDGISGRTLRVPDEDRIWLSLGGSYDVNDHMTMNAGYSYLFTLNDPVVTLRNGPAAGSTVTFDGGAHILSIGGSLKF